MRTSEIGEPYVKAVQDMYKECTTAIKTAVGTTELFQVKVGLHQGSALSPFFFALIMDRPPLYVSRQSYVRAKVISFLLGDPSVDDAAKQAAADKAAKYYTLAWSYIQPQSGQLFAMAGLSGSGKSTVAQELARQLPGIYMRSDAVRKHLAGIAVQQRGTDSLYTPEMTQKTYKRLVQLGSELASQGYNIILDAKFDRVATRQLAIAQAVAHQLPLTIVHCEAPLETLKQRVKERSGDIADATLAVLEKQHLETFTSAEQPYVTTIETTQPLSAQLATIV